MAIGIAGVALIRQEMFGFFIALTIIFPAIILVFIFSIIRKKQRDKQYLLKNGEQAKAKVLSVSDTGVTINGSPRIALQLEVTTQKGFIFNTQIHTLISRIQPTFYQPGMILQVRYDPNNLKSVAIEPFGENLKYNDDLHNTRREHSSGKNNIEIKPLLCPTCGGQIKMDNSPLREKMITCNYCGTVIDLQE